MKLSLNKVVDKIVWLSTVFLLASFLLFETISWGRYIFLGVTLIIILSYAIVNNGKVDIKIKVYHCLFAVFTLFVLISSFWAWSVFAAISKAITLALILICSSVVYMYYQKKEDIHELLTAVMWSGYLIALYAMFFYGVENFGADVEMARLENSFSNVNTIGLIVALSCVLQFNESLHKRNLLSAIMMIPSVYVIAATQSRKALVFLIGGVYMVYVLKILSQRGAFGKVFRVCGYTMVFVLSAFLILQFPVFSGVLERMSALIPGSDVVESSFDMRSEMLRIGIDCFKGHPIGGIGIGSSGILTQTYLFKSTYLHNNFVELLACGGIIGFVCYYAIYAYLFVNLIKHRKSDPEYFAIGFTWLVIMLVMNYGMVTYYEKLQWYYLMIHFLNLECMRRKRGKQNV